MKLLMLQREPQIDRLVMVLLVGQSKNDESLRSAKPTQYSQSLSKLSASLTGPERGFRADGKEDPSRDGTENLWKSHMRVLGG